MPTVTEQAAFCFSTVLMRSAAPAGRDRAMCSCIDRVFEDKRLAVGLLMVWLCIVAVVFKDIGLLETRFVTFGPSAGTIFMGVTLDTWYKWSLVATFTFINTLVNDFMSDAISPWIVNTITDHKTRYIPYPKGVCLMITQMWAVYCNLMGVLALFIAMTQIDFVLIRMGADLTVNMYTNLKFMHNKVHNASRYHESAFEGPAYHPRPCDDGDSCAGVAGSPGEAEMSSVFSITSHEDESDRSALMREGAGKV